MKKKIMCFFFAFVFVLSVFPFSAFASENNVEYTDLSTTTIDYDFFSVFGCAYSVDTYSYDKTKNELQFITAMESRGGTSNNFEIYFYVYNPSRKVIEVDSKSNKVNMAKYIDNIKDGDVTTNDFNNYRLTFVNSYADTIDTKGYTDGLILKFKVSDTFNCSNDARRFYRIVELELLEMDDVLGQNFPVNKEFIFANRNALAGRNYKFVSCTINDLSSVIVDAYHTFYRVNTEGINKYTDVYSVYFPVSNTLLKANGGEVREIKIEWVKYKTNNILVFDDTTVLSRFENWMYGNKPYYADFRYSLIYTDHESASFFDDYTYGYNVESMEEYFQCYSDGDVYDDKTDSFLAYWGYDYDDEDYIFPDFWSVSQSRYNLPLALALYSDDVTSYEKAVVSGEEIIDYFNNHHWSKNLYSSVKENSNVFKVKSPSTVMPIYEKSGFWSAFFCGGYYDTETGKSVEFDTFKKINLSHLKKMSAEEFSKEYLVDLDDVTCTNLECGECLTCRVNDPKYDDCTWYMLRYDTAEYNSYEALVLDNQQGTSHKAFVSNCSVINNFDVITLGLGDGTVDENGKEIINVFPVGHAPSQFAPDLWTPEETPTFDEYLKSSVDSFLEWLMETLVPILRIALIAITVLLIIKIVVPLIPKRIKVDNNRSDNKDEKK